MKEEFNAPETPAPDNSKNFEWYQYFGPFSILIIYFIALAFCKLCQGITKKCNRRSADESSNSTSPEGDRYVYDVSTDSLRRESSDLPPSYSSTGLSNLADNVVVESGSERRRRQKRTPLDAQEEEEKLPSYSEIIEDDQNFGGANANLAYEEGEEDKTDLEEGDRVSISSERNLPPPPPYRPPNL